MKVKPIVDKAKVLWWNGIESEGYPRELLWGEYEGIMESAFYDKLSFLGLSKKVAERKIIRKIQKRLNNGIISNKSRGVYPDGKR